MIKKLKHFYTEILILIIFAISIPSFHLLKAQKTEDLSTFHNEGVFEGIIDNFDLKNIELKKMNTFEAYKINIPEEEVNNLIPIQINIKEYEDNIFNNGYNAYLYYKDNVVYTLFQYGSNIEREYFIYQAKITVKSYDNFKLINTKKENTYTINEELYQKMIDVYSDKKISSFSKEGNFDYFIFDGKSKYLSSVEFSFNNFGYDLLVDSYLHEKRSSFSFFDYLIFSLFFILSTAMKYRFIKYGRRDLPNQIIDPLNLDFKNNKKIQKENEQFLKDYINNKNIIHNKNVKIKND